MSNWKAHQGRWGIFSLNCSQILYIIISFRFMISSAECVSLYPALPEVVQESFLYCANTFWDGQTNVSCTLNGAFNGLISFSKGQDWEQKLCWLRTLRVPVTGLGFISINYVGSVKVHNNPETGLCFPSHRRKWGSEKWRHLIRIARLIVNSHPAVWLQTSGLSTTSPASSKTLCAQRRLRFLERGF